MQTYIYAEGKYATLFISAFVLSLEKGRKTERWREGRREGIERIKKTKCKLQINGKQIMLYLSMKYQTAMKMEKLAISI